jgi:hypothetical protein
MGPVPTVPLPPIPVSAPVILATLAMAALVVAAQYYSLRPYADVVKTVHLIALPILYPVIERWVGGVGSAYEIGERFDGGNPHIGTCNFGGAMGRSLEPTFAGQYGAQVAHLNYEPFVDYGQIGQLIDHRSDRPFSLDSIALYNVSATINRLHYLNGVELGYYPVPAVNGSVIINNLVYINSDTTTAVNSPTRSIVYEGKSGEVNNANGGTLTEPVACLGDLSTVT